MDDDILAVIPNAMSSKESRQNWARLIQKVYEVGPLICPKCWGQMHIISFIEELDIIEKILRHLGLWDAIQPIEDEPATFVELEPPFAATDCVIEMEKPSGVKLRMCFRGRADPAAIDLGRYFLEGLP